jgi:hypothetical protein
MSKPDLAQAWRQRLDDFANSGRSVVDWCYFNQVSVHQYYYWKRRLAAPLPPATAQPQWLPVEVEPTLPSPATPTGVSVRLGAITIDVTAEFDPVTLRAVVRALSERTC